MGEQARANRLALAEGRCLGGEPLPGGRGAEAGRILLSPGREPSISARGRAGGSADPPAAPGWRGRRQRRRRNRGCLARPAPAAARPDNARRGHSTPRSGIGASPPCRRHWREGGKRHRPFQALRQCRAGNQADQHRREPGHVGHSCGRGPRPCSSSKGLSDAGGKGPAGWRARPAAPSERRGRQSPATGYPRRRSGAPPGSRGRGEARFGQPGAEDHLHLADAGEEQTASTPSTAIRARASSQALAHRAFRHCLAHLEIAGRDRPEAAARFDGAAAEQHPCPPPCAPPIPPPPSGSHRR